MNIGKFDEEEEEELSLILLSLGLIHVENTLLEYYFCI
jgi:hypothetical protein